MQIIYNDDYLNSKYTDKVNIFQREISEHPFILLARPRKNIYNNKINQNQFLQRVEKNYRFWIKVSWITLGRQW